MNSIIDINESTIKNFIESIRPKDLEVRKQVDIGYSYDGKIVELFEIRPYFLDASIKDKFPFAKIRFYKSTQLWSLYWMLSSGKWEIYTPFPKSTHLDKIIEVIKEDKNACFFG